MQHLIHGFKGSIKIWEFSSGQELKTYSLDPPREDDQTIMWMAYLPGSDGDDDKQQSADIEQSGNVNSGENIISTILIHCIVCFDFTGDNKPFTHLPVSQSQLIMLKFDFSNSVMSKQATFHCLVYS